MLTSCYGHTQAGRPLLASKVSLSYGNDNCDQLSWLWLPKLVTANNLLETLTYNSASLDISESQDPDTLKDLPENTEPVKADF